jgi:Transposase DDE domain group 1
VRWVWGAWDGGSPSCTSLTHISKGVNLIGLMALNREMVGQAEPPASSDHVVLDMDSSESPVHGEQEGSAYNGHFESVCYHPLFLFNHYGDCLAAKLRPGNGYEKPQLGALGFSRNPGKGHAVKNLAEGLKVEAVRYELLRGWEVKTKIPD